MMKRISCVILICLVLFTSCSQPESNRNLQDSVDFYYLRTELSYNNADGVITAEKREAAGKQDDLKYLMELYIQGPTTEHLKSPFPKNLRLIDVKVLGDTVFVKLSNRFATLTDTDLTLACACLTKTCLSLTEANQVTISADTQALDGSQSITLSENDLLLLDQITTEPQ